MEGRRQRSLVGAGVAVRFEHGFSGPRRDGRRWVVWWPEVGYLGAVCQGPTGQYYWYCYGVVNQTDAVLLYVDKDKVQRQAVSRVEEKEEKLLSGLLPSERTAASSPPFFSVGRSRHPGQPTAAPL